MDEAQVKAIVDEIKQVLTASSSRKRERAERAKAEDFDAEEGELLKEENDQEEELFDQVCDSGFSYIYFFVCFSISSLLSYMTLALYTSQVRRVTFM